MENLPQINLPDYKKVAGQIEKRKIIVEDKETESALKWIQNSRAKFTALNRPCEKGDFVEIEFEYKAVAPIKTPSGHESRKMKDSFVLGRGGFLPGFEENILGMSSAQEKEFSISLPQGKEKEPKQVPFKVKMKSVQKMELPEICDEWARGLGSFKNLEELKKSIKKGLDKEKNAQESQRVRQEILEKISRESKLETPKILIEKELDSLIDNLKQNVLNSLKISFEEYLQKVKKTEKEIRDSFRSEAEKRVGMGLVLQAISKNENIKVSEAEIKERADAFLKTLKTTEEAQKTLDPEQLKEYIKKVLRNEKTLSLLENMTKG